MKFKPAIGCIYLLALTACGGGGGSTPPPTTGPSPTPTLNVSLSKNSETIAIDEGETTAFGFNANFTGRSSSPIVADVEVSGRRYRLAGPPTRSGESFTVNLATVPFPAGGATTSNVRFRLCTSPDCSTVYPGSERVFTVNLDVRLEDWSTVQRNNAHTGYLAVRYEPKDFARVWEWEDRFESNRIRPVAAGRGRVYSTVGRDGGIAFNGTARAIAFDSSNGSVDWTYDLGDEIFDMGGPSLSADKVHFTTLSFGSPRGQWVLGRTTGTFLNRMDFGAQFTNFNQAPVLGDLLYLSAGQTGGVTYAFDTSLGTTLWRTTTVNPGIWGGQSLAIDENFVYNYRGSVLEVLNRQNGSINRQIADPEFDNLAIDYEAAPLLDRKNGRIFMFAGNKRLGSSSPILAMSLIDNSILWRTPASYTTQFAFRDGTIYAARNDARVLSAIDAATGAVLWSRQLPGANVLTGNVIVTQNLVFVSSDSEVWAIDLEDNAHPIVWSAPTGGAIAITPDNLLITTGKRFAHKITAYRLF